VRDTTTVTTRDWVNLVTVSGGGHSVSGTLVGLRAEPRVVAVDGHRVDVPPPPHMVVVRNDDRPGVIGRVGTVLGEAGVNIADMDVGRTDEGGSALMVIATSQAVPAGVAEALRQAEGILSVAVIDRA
jgi:D-3-phosphoglycerate dehydrogenase